MQEEKMKTEVKGEQMISGTWIEIDNTVLDLDGTEQIVITTLAQYEDNKSISLTFTFVSGDFYTVAVTPDFIASIKELLMLKL